VDARRQLSGYLRGAGIEVGPGHNPFPLEVPGTSVQYVDRWNPEENRNLFPELDEPEFPRPDVVCNFDEDLLRPLADATQDFVVCSHVLEHLANPLGFLGDIHRVLRPAGVALILLPDRHRTFDQSRNPTPLAHVVADYEAGATEVDAAHIEDFLVNTAAVSGKEWSEASSEGRQALITLHRNRSIHVHCWDEPEFSSVLCYAIEHLGQTWELVDAVFTDDGGPASIEFGYVLRRSAVFTPSQARQRFSDDLERLRQTRKRPPSHPSDSPSVPVSGELPWAQVIERKDAEIARLRAELQAVYATKLFRYAAPLRQIYARLKARQKRP